MNSKTLKTYNIVFYSLVAAAFLFIFFSNPFLKLPYDPWAHLLRIVSLHDDGKCVEFWPSYLISPGSVIQRSFWYSIWAYFFRIIGINDIFTWAKIIHIVQFVIAAVILYYFSKTALTILINKTVVRHCDKKDNESNPPLPPFNKVGQSELSDEKETIRIKFLSLFAVFLWFIGNGTFSVQYQQAWIMWYSVTYQGLTIPLFWYSVALTLKLFYEDLTNRKKLFFIVQIVIVSFIMTKVHATEFLYYLINLVIIFLVNINKIVPRKKKLLPMVFLGIAAIILVIFVLIKYFLPEYSSILERFSSIKNAGQILQQIKVLGREIVPGLNRYPNSFSEIALISIITGVIYKIISIFKFQKLFPLTLIDYLLISSVLFFLIPVIPFFAGTAGFFTQPVIVYRFFFASPWFIFLPFIIYVIIRSENIRKVLTENPIYRLLIKNEKIIISSEKRFITLSIVTIIVIVLLIVPNKTFLKHIAADTLSFKTTILNVKSIMNSLDEKKVGIQYSKDYIEAIGEAIKKCEQSNKGKTNLYFIRGRSPITGGVGDEAYIIRGVYRKYVFCGRQGSIPKEFFLKWSLDARYNLIDIDHPEECTDRKE